MTHVTPIPFAATEILCLRCMVNYVARSALSYHSPFLHIFQQAAARAYIRVRCGGSQANAFDTGLGDSFSRASFDPISDPRCAFPRMIVFSILTECLQECQTRCFLSATLGQSTSASSARAALLVTSPSRTRSSPPCL